MKTMILFPLKSFLRVLWESSGSSRTEKIEDDIARASRAVSATNVRCRPSASTAPQSTENASPS